VRAQRNRSIKSAVKTKVTKFRRAIVEHDERAEELALVAVSALDRAAAKGVLHRNNAARRKARVTQRLNASGIAAPPQPASAPPARASRATKAPSAPARKAASASTRNPAASKKTAPAKPATRSKTR
jgi:small subunit ribosomal protein S20